MARKETQAHPINVPPVMKILRRGQSVSPSLVARYTRFVHVSKAFLWISIAGMVGIVVWIGSGNSGVGVPRIVMSNVPHVGNLQDVMLKPRYQGLDVHNQPYTVSADSAIQKDKDTVGMEVIHADLMRKNGTWLGLDSAKGELNNQTKQMLLTGGVSLFADGGYEFRTEHAQVDIQKGTAYGDAHVEGQGPPGTLEADGFSISDNHQHVIHFNGSVKMVLSLRHDEAFHSIAVYGRRNSAASSGTAFANAQMPEQANTATMRRSKSPPISWR